MADPIDTKPLRNDVAECVERARGLHIMPVMTVTAGLMLALLDALDAERARAAELRDRVSELELVMDTLQLGS